jgi:hypothetical protein
MLRDGIPDVVPLGLDEQHPYIPSASISTEMPASYSS